MNSLYATILLVVCSVQLLSCNSPSTPDPPDDEFDRALMLDNFGRAVIIPSYEGLQRAVDALETETAAFASDPSEATLSDLRNSLKAARLAWQDANLFQFGPAETVTLRTALNTYPVDANKVEANIESGTYTLGTIENRAAVGLPALGYLLHGRPTDEEILANFSVDMHAGTRLAYLQDNVAFIKQAVDATLSGWADDGDNYIDIFLSQARAGTDVGSSLGMLVNAFVLHFERFIRDGKIGIPAGVRSAGVPRPTSTEAFHGGYSVELATANVRAVKRLFQGNSLTGGEGIGLDDNLRALDADELANQLVAEMDEAIVALEALEDPLSGQIEGDIQSVLGAFTELQDVIVLLKADMTSVLGITITFQDNDGD